MEDVTEVILNLKALSLKIHSDEEKVFEIDAEGEGVVTAGDIRADSDVEILNPDLHIATLGPGARLHMRILPVAVVAMSRRIGTNAMTSLSASFPSIRSTLRLAVLTTAWKIRVLAK